MTLLNYAQNDPWVYVMDEVPASIEPKKLVRTFDDNFVSATLTDENAAIVMYKVSADGSGHF